MLNPVTGAATFAANLSTFATGSTLPDLGVAFDPVTDRIRIVTDSDFNFRADPVTGNVLTDTSINFAAGDPNAGQAANVIGAAYTNGFAGATSTTLYDIDSNSDVLVIQDPPNSELFTRSAVWA